MDAVTAPGGEPPIPDGGAPAAPTPSERAQARRETIRLLLRQPGFIIGNVIIVFWVACALFGDLVAPFDPYDDLFVGHSPPSVDHLFGTDRLGRDIFSRVIVGARDVFIIAPLSAGFGVAAGTILGLIMGHYRGVVDDVLGRVVEAFLALPVILTALLTLVVLGSSTSVVVLVVGILFTPIVARTVRSAVIAERQLDYVTAARLRGETGPFIMVREILPNILPPIVVELTVRIGYAIFTVATLSFLGVGIQPPSPDWGLQVAEEFNNMISGVWWPTFFPALAIATTVVAVNLIADALASVTAE